MAVHFAGRLLFSWAVLLGLIMAALERLAVLGAGAWGRALAGQFAGAGPVTLWSHNPARLQAIKGADDKPIDRITYTTQLSEAVDDAAVLVIAVPSAGVPKLMAEIKGLVDQGSITTHARPIVLAAKGFADNGQGLLGELCASALPTYPFSVLSGPSFAADLAAGLPTAIALAIDPKGPGHRDLAPDLLHRLAAPAFRVYLVDDVVGVQVGGAAKNVSAIACGIAAGLDYGSNTHAALISRGLAEISRLAAALGGQPQTMMGLAGVGDLVLTCSNTKSRNYSYGLRRGQGMGHDEAVAASAGVIEGIDNAANVMALAAKHQVDMPITAAINALLREEASLADIIKGLMARPYRGEGGAWSDIALTT